MEYFLWIMQSYAYKKSESWKFGCKKEFKDLGNFFRISKSGNGYCVKGEV